MGLYNKIKREHVFIFLILLCALIVFDYFGTDYSGLSVRQKDNCISTGGICCKIGEGRGDHYFSVDTTCGDKECWKECGKSESVSYSASPLTSFSITDTINSGWEWVKGLFVGKKAAVGGATILVGRVETHGGAYNLIKTEPNGEWMVDNRGSDFGGLSILNYCKIKWPDTGVTEAKSVTPTRQSATFSWADGSSALAVQNEYECYGTGTGIFKPPSSSTVCDESSPHETIYEDTGVYGSGYYGSWRTIKELTLPVSVFRKNSGCKIYFDVLGHGTGVFTHPVWLKELKQNLTEEDSTGILKTETGFNFMLTTEVSQIYPHDNQLRKIHNLIFAPDFETVDQINDMLSKHGRLDYDGRPIFGGFTCPALVEKLKQINPRIEVIPAHCLLGQTLIHTNYSIKKIKEIKKGDLVYTHNNKWQKVTDILIRPYSSKIYHVRPWYFSEGLKTTLEHPFYAIKSYKCSWIKGLCKKSCSKLLECKNKKFERYIKEWVPASELKPGDILIYPRFSGITKIKTFQGIEITKELCKLIGYYLAEGYTIREEGIGFSFNRNENLYIKEVINLIDKIFRKKEFKIDTRKGRDIIFYSKKLNKFFSNFYNSKIRKANSKKYPKKYA